MKHNDNPILDLDLDLVYFDKQLNENYTLLKFAIEYNHSNIVEWICTIKQQSYHYNNMKN